MAARQRAIAAAKAKKAAAAAANSNTPKLQAAPQMMKFSQWQEQPEDTKANFEEGPIIEVETQLSDDEFEAMIHTIDAKKSKDTDFFSLIKSIEDTKQLENAETGSEKAEH